MSSPAKTLIVPRLPTLLLSATVILGLPVDAGAAAPFRSPFATAYSPDGKSIAVSDATAAEVVVMSAEDGAVAKNVKLSGEPRGVRWTEGGLLVAEYDNGTIAEVNPTSGTVTKRYAVGPKPVDVGVSEAKGLMVVTDFGLGKVYMVKRATGERVGSVDVANYPYLLDVTPDGSKAVVGHLLPTGDATKEGHAAGLSLVSLDPPKLDTAIALPQGSGSIRGVKCSPDGKWVYVAHVLGRTTVPVTQGVRGFVSTNALSIIDLTSSALYATVLLDRITEGAADPWGIAITNTGKTLWVTSSGAHQVIRLDLESLHGVLAGTLPAPRTIGGTTPTLFNRSKKNYVAPLSDIWFEVAVDTKKRALLQDDLGALWSARLLQITRLSPGDGPRGIASSPDGKQLAVATYFAGKLAQVDAETGKLIRSAAVGTQPEETAARRGERMFHDALSTLQHWLSCNTCHPDGRADGFNRKWGFGAAGAIANTRSTVYSPATPPDIAHGGRGTAKLAIAMGFKFIKFIVPSDLHVDSVEAYLTSLAAEWAPYRVGGAMTEQASKGAALFAKAECDRCHSGTYFADLKAHDVGTKAAGDTTAEFDTPTLLELWRTAPYLHDGRAATIREVLTTANKGDAHGKTSQFSPAEIEQLAAYVLQLPGDAMPPRIDGGVMGAGGAGGGGIVDPSAGGAAGGADLGAGGAGGMGIGGTPGGEDGSDGGAQDKKAGKANSSGCQCSLGRRSGDARALIAWIFLLVAVWCGRGRGRGFGPLLLLGLSLVFSQSASAAPIDLKDPKFAVLDKILVIKRTPGSGSIIYQYYGHQSASGGLYILENVLSGAATERDLLASANLGSGKKLVGGAFLSPDLSYDAKEVLFAYADKGGPFHIFKVNVDGTGLTQLTEGTFDDFDPVFLPDGRIMFVSTRRGGYSRTNTMTMPVYTLHVMDANGANLHAVSLHEAHEWNPSVDNNGMVVYSRRDCVDRGAARSHMGWITTPDGLDPRSIGSNYAPAADYNVIDVPVGLLQLRSIPGSNKYVGTAVAHHSSSYGSLVIFDPDTEDDDALAQYTRITPDALFPEVPPTCASCDNKYATPWALDEDHFLCVHDPAGKLFGVYLIDRAGNKVLLKAASDIAYLDPIPLAPRPKPDIVAAPPKTAKLTDEVLVTVMNVYDSFYPWPEKTEIKELRIVQVHPKTTIQANSPRLGHGGTDGNEQNGRSVLGTVPVESDGSASFLLPPGKPVYFQALDAKGVAIQTMMSDTYAVPGSAHLSCQGCHEPRYRTVHPGKSYPIASLRSPTPIKPEADGTRPMNFPRLIQPLLDSKCNAGCHATQAPVLTGGGNGFSTAYMNLYPYVTFYLSQYPGIGRPSGFNIKSHILPTNSIPGKINGARASKLYPLLEAGHKGVVLTPEELRRFAVWLDNNSDFYGHSTNLAAQARGDVVAPAIE